jgi:hypothetical protein
VNSGSGLIENMRILYSVDYICVLVITKAGVGQCLWYRLADANSLAVAPDAQLLDGLTLTLPKLSLSANNADSAHPYDPSQTLGNTSPTLPDLPMPQGSGGGCGAMGQIIVLAIKVAVAVQTGINVSAWANSAAVGFGKTAAAVVGGAVGGAAGSIAGQAAGMAMGMQQDFNWNQVAISAIGGAVGGGLNTEGVMAGKSFGMTVARAAVGNALTQGISVATGLQQHFDWTSVAASAVGAGVGHAVGG